MLFKRAKLGKYHVNFTKSHKEPPFYFLKKIFKKIILVCLIFGVIYFIFFSSFFMVKSLEIEGNKLVKTATIEKAFSTDENIFLYPIDKITTEIIKKYPEISSINVYRGLPNTIKIEISEYQPRIYWIRGGVKGLVNENGIYYYQTEENNKTAELIKVIEQVQSNLNIGNRVATPSFIAFIEKVKAGFSDYKNLTFDHIEIDASSFDIVVKTKENINVLMTTDNDVDRQLSYLKLILEKRRNKVTKKIDVRISRWGYVE